MQTVIIEQKNYSESSYGRKRNVNIIVGRQTGHGSA